MYSLANRGDILSSLVDMFATHAPAMPDAALMMFCDVCIRYEQLLCVWC